jgi:hypothetical protein
MKQITNTLTKLPKTLNDTYVRIIENIDEDYCRYVHDVLNLIAFSMRPLKLGEIVEAIAFDVEKKCFSAEEKLGDPLDVLEICSSLISFPDKQTLMEGTHSYEKGSNEQEVRFPHFSVKEFLTDNNLSDNRFHISNEHANELIAERCLLYMISNLDAIDFQTPNLLEKFPFLNYSSRYWYDHVNKIPMNANQKALKDLVIELFLSKGGNDFYTWLRVWDPDRGFEMQGNSGWPEKLHYSSLLGLSDGWPEKLYYSSLLGLSDVARLLLDKGADVNAEGGRFGNALQAASFNGHRGVVELLLDKGADVNAQGGQLGSALIAASLHGHRRVVELLLDKGADVNAKGADCGNALQAASLNGHRGVVDLLLDKGADGA